VKLSQRLDYNRLAEVLAERKMVEPGAINELLQGSNDGGQAFPEALIAANLISDWDLSRVVCEVFQLPFLPIEFIKPNADLLEMFDPVFLHDSGLVPLARFGNVLTLAMPALVPADILAMLAAETDMVLLPVVGTVTTNRRWINDNVALKKASEEGGWGNLFDEGEAAVQEALDVVDDDSIEFTDTGDETPNLEDIPGLTDMEDAGAELEFEDIGDEDTDSLSGGNMSLPPMPDFG
jgi:hypothetical protein